MASDPALMHRVLEYLQAKNPDRAVFALEQAYGKDWGKEGFPLYMQYGRLFRKYSGKKYVEFFATELSAGTLSQYKVKKFSGPFSSLGMKF